MHGVQGRMRGVRDLPSGEASRQTYLGLYALQHRGQEAAGICSGDGQGLHLHKAQGYVADVFTEAVLDALPGTRPSATPATPPPAATWPPRPIPSWCRGASARWPSAITGTSPTPKHCAPGSSPTGTCSAALRIREVILALINRAPADTLEDARRGGPPPGRGRLLAADSHGGRPHRRPGSPRLPAPGHGAPGRDPRLLLSETCAFDLRGGPVRAGCGARRAGDPGPETARSAPGSPCPGCGPSPACSSTSISPGPIPWSMAGA